MPWKLHLNMTRYNSVIYCTYICKHSNKWINNNNNKWVVIGYYTMYTIINTNDILIYYSKYRPNLVYFIFLLPYNIHI